MYRKTKKFNAFTLAEVLITLAIIGVVAALTLPTLMVRAKEKQRVAQLKKSYTVLNQAFLRAKEKYGEMQDWGLAITNTGAKDENNNPIYDYSGSIKALNYLSEFMDTKQGTEDLVFKYYTLDGRLTNEEYTIPAGKYVYLNDSTILVAGWVSFGETGSDLSFQNCVDFYIVYADCIKQNGCTMGKDMFYFKLVADNGMLPNGLPYTNSKYMTGNPQNFTSQCNLSKNISTNGRECTAWVIYNGNMDYLHCNDLSWDGKHKCK